MLHSLILKKKSFRNPYQGDWTGGGWAKVQEDFACGFPEPEIVVLAAYVYEDYSGDAWVVYFDKGRFFEVHGGHCSCYGLERQWDSISYEPADFVEVLKRRTSAYGLQGEMRLDVLVEVEAILAGIAG